MNQYLALALAIGALLRLAPAWGDEGPTCDADGYHSGVIIIADMAGQLHGLDDVLNIDGLIVIYPDGSVDATGTARIPREGTYRALAGSVQCTDVDGDGARYNPYITVDYVEVPEGRTAGAQAIFSPKSEIDKPGGYVAGVLWNGAPVGDAVLRVRFIPAARP